MPEASHKSPFTTTAPTSYDVRNDTNIESDKVRGNIKLI